MTLSLYSGDKTEEGATGVKEIKNTFLFEINILFGLKIIIFNQLSSNKH